MDVPMAAVVLAGGRSRRMGEDKAWLDWDGRTLLARTVDTLVEAGAGPVVVVRAPEQSLPRLDGAVRVVDDQRRDGGPLVALSTGLAAIGDAADAAFVAATDLPLLHAAFVRRVCAALVAAPSSEAAVPVVDGTWHVLAAAYRTSLAAPAQAAADAGRLRLQEFVRGRAVTVLGEDELRADPALAAADPGLASVTNVNRPADLVRARAAHRG